MASPMRGRGSHRLNPFLPRVGSPEMASPMRARGMHQLFRRVGSPVMASPTHPRRALRRVGSLVMASPMRAWRCTLITVQWSAALLLAHRRPRRVSKPRLGLHSANWHPRCTSQRAAPQSAAHSTLGKSIESSTRWRTTFWPTVPRPLTRRSFERGTAYTHDGSRPATTTSGKFTR